MCRIKAKVFDWDVRVQLSEFSEGNDAGNTVMPFGIKETDMKWKIRLVLFIVAGQHVERMTVIVNIEITVPSPGCIRVRKMAWTGTVGNAIFSTVAYFMSVRAGMGMDTCAIARNGKTARRNESKFQRRDDGRNGKQLLEGFFVMKMEIPVLLCITGSFPSETTSVGRGGLSLCMW